MAKVIDFKFEINGEKFTVNVNCNSSGQFTAKLPDTVHTALQLQSTITDTTLSSLSKRFYESVDRYKSAKTTEELFILIRYAASGRYMHYKDGRMMFGGYNHPLILGGNSTTISNNVRGLGFEFHVCVKETIDGVVTWFDARKGKDFMQNGNDTSMDDETYYKDKHSKFWEDKEYKKIPFSDTALSTLLVAEEKIRSASESLFNFIEQDEQAIELTLTNQKLLQ